MKELVPLIISESFKTRLITGILSSPIIYVPHFHYNYVDGALSEVLSVSGDKDRSVLGLTQETLYEFDIKRNRICFSTKESEHDNIRLETVLDNILNRNEANEMEDTLGDCKIFLFKNLFHGANNSIGGVSPVDLSVLLKLQTFAEKYERGDYDPRTTIIMVSPVPASQLPKELIDIITVIDVLAPSLEEIEQCVKAIPVSEQFKIKGDSLVTDLCRTLQGLSLYDIQQILRSVLVRTGGRLTEKTITLALEEKKQIVRKSGIIEVVDSDVGFEDVGGLEVLCDDMRQKAVVFKHLSRAVDKDVNIPIPKGILIVGMPGCGKSMIAKAIAKEFGVSLLRLDISRLMGQYVGESEENLRKALATAEAAHPCVLWIDEIEKAFHGASNSSGNEADNLVMRMMGHFLTWMQERKTAVYIVATANDVMRPEFMRKGRFDEVYFVDFPNEEERKAIFKKKIDKYNNTEEHPSIFDFMGAENALDEIAKSAVANKSVEGKSGGFSGAEIDCVVNAIVEKKFTDYATMALDNELQYPLPIKITKMDFDKVIEEMKPHVMSGQVSVKSDGLKDDKDKSSLHFPSEFVELTQIEKIYRMFDNYKFKSASK